MSEIGSNVQTETQSKAEISNTICPLYDKRSNRCWENDIESYPCSCRGDETKCSRDEKWKKKENMCLYYLGTERYKVGGLCLLHPDKECATSCKGNRCDCERKQKKQRKRAAFLFLIVAF